MKYDFYAAIRITDDLSVFDFVSIGERGHVPKRIIFMPTEIGQVYNLAFGDIKETGEIDDYSVTDNGDRNKILATIVDVVSTYTERYPERMIYFKGSTKERTRLYRMAIGLNLEELLQTFDIYAQVEWSDHFIRFRKNIEIIAFLVKRKLLRQIITILNFFVNCIAV
jgi:hypothetical protein